jgi:hypothetical protein
MDTQRTEPEPIGGVKEKIPSGKEEDDTPVDAKKPHEGFITRMNCSL